jgi:hypothetical protein
VLKTFSVNAKLLLAATGATFAGSARATPFSAGALSLKDAAGSHIRDGSMAWLGRLA